MCVILSGDLLVELLVESCKRDLCVCVILSGDLLVKSCRRDLCVCVIICLSSLVVKSCRRDLCLCVCVCDPFWRFACRV